MKVSEKTVRTSIAMMRSIANKEIAWPFLKEVAKEMEYLIDELVELRKQNVSTKKKVPTKGTKNGN